MLTSIACLVGLISGGAGHGSYVAVRLVLPYACASVGMYSCAGILVCASALLQWPVYGYVIDKAKMKRVAATALLLLHGALCVWLFASHSSSF